MQKKKENKNPLVSKSVAQHGAAHLTRQLSTRESEQAHL
jgi:hypothetical protein